MCSCVVYPRQGLGAGDEGGGEEEEARQEWDQGWAVDWGHLKSNLGSPSDLEKTTKLILRAFQILDLEIWFGGESENFV